MEHTSAESIVKFGKKSIVQMARKLIKEDIGKDIPEIYETTVFANESSVIIFFESPIKLARKNTAFYYGVSVDLISETKTYKPIINTEKQVDASKHFPFYQPTARDKHWVEFVLNSNNGEKTSYRKYWKTLYNDHKALTIIEQNTFFDVKVLSPSLSTCYKVDKNTGTLMDRSHRQIKTESLLKQGYSEIKE